MDNEDFFRKRLIELRTRKGVSAREMSLSLGLHAGYIYKIENNKMFPSMSLFFYMCDYLKITPEQFFNTTILPENLLLSPKLEVLVDDLKRLDEETIEGFSILTKKLIEKL